MRTWISIFRVVLKRARLQTKTARMMMAGAGVVHLFAAASAIATGMAAPRSQWVLETFPKRAVRAPLQHVCLAMDEEDKAAGAEETADSEHRMSALFAQEMARQAEPVAAPTQRSHSTENKDTVKARPAAKLREAAKAAWRAKQESTLRPAGATTRGSRRAWLQPPGPGDRFLARDHAAARQDAAARKRHQASSFKAGAAAQFGDFEPGRLSEQSGGAQIVAGPDPSRLSELSMGQVRSLGEVSREEAARAEEAAREAEKEAEAEAARVARDQTGEAGMREVSKDRASAATARAVRFLEQEVGALRLQVWSHCASATVTP